MPKGNKTGPAGNGPKTGRKMGYCTGYGTPGYLHPGFGFRGCGIGMGRRWGKGIYIWECPCCGWCSSMNQKDQKKALKTYQENLKAQLLEVDEVLKEFAGTQ